MNKEDCPICGMKYNEPCVLSSFAPSMCTLETTLRNLGDENCMYAFRRLVGVWQKEQEAR